MQRGVLGEAHLDWRHSTSERMNWTSKLWWCPDRPCTMESHYTLLFCELKVRDAKMGHKREEMRALVAQS